MLLRGPIQGYSESYFLSGCPSGGSDTTYYISENFTASKDTGNGVVLNNLPSDQVWRIVIKSGTTVNNLVFRPMLNAGTEAKPYSKWFAGLKSASFEKIVSTGRNLFGLTADDFKNGTIDGGGKRVNLKLTPNTQYTLSTNTPIYAENTASIWFNGGNSLTSGVWVNQPRTATTDENGKLYITIRTTEIDTIFNSYWIMLNIGSSALPYEPYTSDTLSAETPIELAEYDTAYPETGEIQRQSNTVTFNGTESWYLTTQSEGYFLMALNINPHANKVVGDIISNRGENFAPAGAPNNDFGFYIANADFSALVIWFNKNFYPNVTDLSSAKSQLAAWAEAGDPLTVTYKTAETTTEATPFNKSKYIAWKNGSETIIQGDTDNSIYGAENTVKQDYFTLTGGTTNV